MGSEVNNIATDALGNTIASTPMVESFGSASCDQPITSIGMTECKVTIPAESDDKTNYQSVSFDYEIYIPPGSSPTTFACILGTEYVPDNREQLSTFAWYTGPTYTTVYNTDGSFATYGPVVGSGSAGLIFEDGCSYELWGQISNYLIPLDSKGNSIASGSAYVKIKNVKVTLGFDWNKVDAGWYKFVGNSCAIAHLRGTYTNDIDMSTAEWFDMGDQTYIELALNTETDMYVVVDFQMPDGSNADIPTYTITAVDTTPHGQVVVGVGCSQTFCATAPKLSDPSICTERVKHTYTTSTTNCTKYGTRTVPGQTTTVTCGCCGGSGWHNFGGPNSAWKYMCGPCAGTGKITTTTPAHTETVCLESATIVTEHVYYTIEQVGVEQRLAYAINVDGEGSCKPKTCGACYTVDVDETISTIQGIYFTSDPCYKYLVIRKDDDTDLAYDVDTKECIEYNSNGDCIKTRHKWVPIQCSGKWKTCGHSENIGYTFKASTGGVLTSIGGSAVGSDPLYDWSGAIQECVFGASTEGSRNGGSIYTVEVCSVPLSQCTVCLSVENGGCWTSGSQKSPGGACITITQLGTASFTNVYINEGYYATYVEYNDGVNTYYGEFKETLSVHAYRCGAGITVYTNDIYGGSGSGGGGGGNGPGSLTRSTQKTKQQDKEDPHDSDPAEEPLPSISLSATPNSVCAGETYTVTLFCDGCDGSPSLSGANIGVNSASKAGTLIITATGTNKIGTTTKTVGVVVGDCDQDSDTHSHISVGVDD